MTELPQKRRYTGPLTDTDRWNGFKHRSDDIFICTPPKSGTTWTQAICTALVFDDANHGQQPSVISPWVDANFGPIEPVLERIDALPHRRFMKTHSPFDGIPFFAECTYLVVLRDPRDAYCSGQNHSANMNDKELADANFPSGNNRIEDWLNTETIATNWDMQTLATNAHFLKSYWPYRDLPNVHFHHYSDMKGDLRGSIAKMAEQIGMQVDDAKLDAFTEATSFGSMKKSAEQFAPESGSGIWKAEKNFFASGKSKQWESLFSEDQKAAFHSRLAELLEPDQAEWFLNGSG